MELDLRIAWTPARVQRRVRVLWVAGVVAGLGWAAPRAEHATAQGGQRGLAVASESERAAREAMALLEDPKQPGNAVDAAVAAALVAGVVSPSSSGLGGGGFVNYWISKERRSIILDFREVAPAAVDVAAFDGRPFETGARGHAVGVPGELMGLYELHRRYGKLGWDRVVDTALRVAERGFSVNPHLANTLKNNRDDISLDPNLARSWFSGGRTLARETWVKNPRLGKTLALIKERGPTSFYQGPIAAEIVNTARAHQSAMTLDDLANYRVRERAPLQFSWNGFTVHTMPPPSAGGYLLAHTLALFDPRELEGLGVRSAAYTHALAESFRGAIADRMRHFGDPDFVDVPVADLLNPERLAARRAAIALDRTHALPRFTQSEHGTHHLVVRDGEGNVVSLTTTVNSAFGADFMTPQSGIVLNDELDDFSKDAWVERFGANQSPNRPRPLARPVSSMTPTLITRGDQVVLALGGSGGMNIATDVAQAVLHALLFDATPREVVVAPRLQIPMSGASLRIAESRGPGFVRDLEGRGEIVQRYDTTSSALQLLKVQNGVVSAAADPQKHGFALVR